MTTVKVTFGNFAEQQPAQIAQTIPAFVPQAQPAPSPSGDVPKPAPTRLQEVPKQEPAAPAFKRLADAKRDFVRRRRSRQPSRSARIGVRTAIRSSNRNNSSDSPSATGTAIQNRSGNPIRKARLGAKVHYKAWGQLTISATSLTWKKKLSTTMAAERSQRRHIPLCLAYLTARTSQRSMTGGAARSSSAFCMSAAAIGPLRCAVLSPSF